MCKKISLLHQREKVDVSRVLILFDQGILGPDLASIIKIECYERGEGNKRAVWSKETPVGLESSECSEWFQPDLPCAERVNFSLTYTLTVSFLQKNFGNLKGFQIANYFSLAKLELALCCLLTKNWTSPTVQLAGWFVILLRLLANSVNIQHTAAIPLEIGKNIQKVDWPQL